MIIGITGYAQSGKDTVAKILVDKYGFERRAFADKIRNMLYDMNPMAGGEPVQVKVDSEGWERAKQHPEVRRLLQTTGVAARVHLSDKVWVNAALTNMQLDKHYVITDVRFQNEAFAIRDLGGQIWRVERPGVGAVNSHISEKDMENYKEDILLYNGGTLDELELLIQTRMGPLLSGN